MAYAFPVISISEFKEKLAGIKKEHQRRPIIVLLTGSALMV
jgi:hypothetical protein